MTELAIRSDAATLAAPSSLVAWVQGAREVNAIAERIASSALVPHQYRGKPVDVLACWLTGQELGMAPMAALRSIDVIQGTPSLRAHAMRALVQRAGHKVRTVESTDTRCVLKGRRADDTDDDWQEVEWDIDRARRLGLLDKQGSQWKTQPKTMLIARATGELCRLIAADVLYAVPYATEELDEGHMAPVAPTRTTAAHLLGEPVRAEAVVEEPEPAAKPRKATKTAAPAEPPPAGEEQWPEVPTIPGSEP